MRRVGVLSILAESDVDWRASIKAFQHGLQELGWTDGRNIQINYRGAAGNVEHLNTLAKELAGMAPDLLLATNTPALAALQRMMTQYRLSLCKSPIRSVMALSRALRGQAAA